MSSVTEVKQAPGRWDITLDRATPRSLIDALTPFGHIAIAPGKIDVDVVGDNLLTAARYVGVFRGGKVAGEDYNLEGSGVPFWLGDEDGKGPLIESVSASATTFANTIRLVLPDAIEEGTLYSVAGSATHTFQWQTAKSALNFIVNAFSTPTVPVSWRVNGDCTLDAGPDSSLFNLNPTAILVKKDQVLRTGRGFDVIGISGEMQLEQMYNDYTTKVVVLGTTDTGGAVIAASATLAASAIPYTDMHGNKVAFTRLVDELDADAIGVAPALASSLLSRFDSPSFGASLGSDDYDVRGDFAVGDHVAVYSPDIGFVDYNHEMYYEGVPINPMYLQVVGLTWPVEEGFTVGFRNTSGTWYDLSDYYKPSSGQTLIDVGDNPSGLTSLGFDIDRARIITDASIPATPVFGEFYTSHYLNADGETRGQVLVTWSEPDNTDASTIIDGEHYDIRYRPNVTAPYPATWEEAAQDTWDELYTWMMPRVPPFETDEWHPVEAPWDVEQIMVNELLPSVIYEFQIRAVDGANPPNRSAWSASKAFTVARDTLPPAQPAAPSVAGSRLAIQVVHNLGRNDGGTFNLDLDTAFLEIHVSGDPLFFPDASTLVGRLLVNAALASHVPVVGTFAVEETTERYVRVVAVDRTGNRSNASNTATVTADLIDDQHISDLTASKITAGTISADLLLGGSIRTGESGSRVELNADGLSAYDDDGDLTVNISADPSDTGHYLQFRGDLGDGEGDRILSSVTDEGIVTAQSGYFNHLFLGGDSVADRFAYEPPRGIIAYGTSAQNVEGRGPGDTRGYLELAFDAESGRAYRITQYAEAESTSAVSGERFVFEVLDGQARIPDTADPSLGTVTFPAATLAGNNSTGLNQVVVRCPDDITVGTHRLLWTFKAFSGTATLRGGDGPALFYVEDIGPSDWYENIAVLNDGGFDALSDGGGVSHQPKNPRPLKSYTRNYTCTWAGTYTVSGSTAYLDDSLSAVHQGYDGGYMFGLFGFPEQMFIDLLDARIVSLYFTAYAAWWSRPAGGTAVLGYYDGSPAFERPSEVANTDVFHDIQRVEGWPKIGTVATRLDDFFNSEAENGAWSAIMVGVHDEDVAFESPIFRGRFDGAAQPHPATMRCIYTK